MTVRQWSDFLDGKLEGGGDILITHPAKIEEAGDNSISFIAHPKYHQFAYSSHAAAIIVHQEAEFEHPVKAALIRVEEPYMAFARVLEKFNRRLMLLPAFMHWLQWNLMSVWVKMFSLVRIAL